MVVFEIGGNSLTNKSFEHVVKSKIENIVNFFGEKYRKRIEDRIYNTIFVIVKQQSIASYDILDELNKFLQTIGADKVSDLAPDFLNKNDESSILYFIYHRLSEWILEPKLSVKEEIGYRAFWASYFENEKAEGKNIDELRKNFNNPEFIEKLQQKVDSVDNKRILRKAFVKWVEKFLPWYRTIKNIKYKQQTKLYLDAKQKICRKVLAEVFGEDRLKYINIDGHGYDISNTFIDYITKKPEFRDILDILHYVKMFKSLTGIDFKSLIILNKELEMYEETFQKQINCAKDKILKIFAKIDKEKKDSKVNVNLFELEKFLKEKDVENVYDEMKELCNYINGTKKGTAAYWSSLSTGHGWLNFIVLSENFELDATHEMLHAVSDCNENVTLGFDRTLDEVITEFFALKIENSKLKNADSHLYCTYSVVFPLIENFFNNNLEKIISYYINHTDIDFQIFIGVDNYFLLCNALSELIKISKSVTHPYYRAKQVLKNPFSFKNDKFVEAVNKVQNVMQNIEKYVAEHGQIDLPL